MPRVSDADQRMIEAAQAMLKHSSLSRMNIREVAAKAKVNSGMFHYHFKTKERFIRAVLQDIYEKFIKDFNLTIEGEKTSLEKLRQALFIMAKFTRDNRQLFLSMMQDVLEKNTVVRDFVKDNFKRHGLVIMKLVNECQKEGTIEKRSKYQVMSFIMTSVNFTSFMLGVVENVEASAFQKGMLKGASFLLLSDDALRERVGMTLRGLGAK